MKFFKLIFLFFIASHLYAQPNGELQQAIKQYPDSTAILLKIGKSYLFNQSDSARKYFKKALLLCEISNDQLSKASTFKHFGVLNAVKSQYDSAIYYYDLSAAIYKSINHSEGYADVLTNRGLGYSRIARLTEGIEDLHKALNIYDSLGLIIKKCGTLNNLGLLSQLNGDFDNALKNYQASIKLAPENKENLTRSLINIATIYNRQGKYDSALVIYNKALVELTEQQNLKGISIIHNNISLVYSNMKLYDEAIEQLKKSMFYKVKINDKRGQAITSKNMAEALSALGRYKKAKVWIAKSLRLSEEVDSKKQMLEALLLSAQIDKEIGKYKSSADFYEQYFVLKDSLDKAERAKEIQEIQVKYQAEQREKEIAKLEIQNQQSLLGAQKNANQRNVLLFVLTIILIIVGFLAVLIFSKQKSNKIISSSLKEKETLLKEIHHRVKNNLQVISSLLSLQSRYIEDENAQAAVNESQNRVKSMALIHQKLYQHDNLSGVEALDYIQNLTSALEASYGVDADKVEINYEVDDLNIDVDTIIPIGLILNELISNAFKHAFPDGKKGELLIGLKEEEDSLKLMVQDNGVGTTKDIEKTDTFGMRMIRSLAMKLEAEVNFNFINGTQASIDISSYKLT